MPNPHPTPNRTRPDAPEFLPPGVRRRKDGRLERRYRDHAGDRHTIAGRNGEDLAAFLARSLGHVETRPARHDPRLTVADYLRSWSADLDIRPNSAATHAGNVTRYLIPAFGERVRLAELDTPEGPALIRAAYRRVRHRPGRQLAPRTVELAHATLRRALSQAVTDRRMTTNPARGLNPNGGAGTSTAPKLPGVELAIPSRAELRRLERQVRGDRWHPLFVAATLTGLRQSELLGLSWSAAEPLERHTLTVSVALRRTDRALEDPKTLSSRRTIRFDPMLETVLRARKLEQKREQLRAGDRWSNPHQLIFTTRTGGPLQGREVTRWFHRACDAAGLPRYRWHDLRHAYATGLLESGVDLALISKSMGHSSVAITADTYSHMTDAGRDQVAAAAGRILR
jgi:integrase